MTDTATPQRPEDVVSPITVGALTNKVSPEEARKAGRFVHDKPTPDNSIVLLIDHQIGLMAGVRDFTSLAEYKSNVVGRARIAKALKIPTLVTNDWRDVARRKVDVPASIFSGEESNNLPSQRWEASVIPNATLYAYTTKEQGDHFLMFKNPTEFTDDLRSFLER